MTMRVVAGGGGSAEAEVDVLGHFCSTLGSDARVLNIPWAQADPAVPELAEWVRSALSVHGVTRVDTAASLSFPSARLDAYDGLFLGGGNTYLLLRRLRSSGLAKLLIAAVRAGLPCYGGSAGAIVLGAHIGTCAHLDRDDVGTSDLHGLDLLGGFAVWCHFRACDDDKARTFARESRLRVLAIPENAGFAFDGVKLTAIGPGVARVWTAGGPSPTGPQ
ncbi:MAG: Type 1 glutamine amidotransferase-like domain-containing protein [Deltaproteobacteria bacterium]